ncbi:hypothetical protein TRVL_06493 [Trypanosoma vivax]|nr:hypothetical protein TRVL_06493 [Trypanosoma vivax]
MLCPSVLHDVVPQHLYGIRARSSSACVRRVLCVTLRVRFFRVGFSLCSSAARHILEIRVSKCRSSRRVALFSVLAYGPFPLRVLLSCFLYRFGRFCADP